MQEARATEEVHHISHWDRLGKGVVKGTVEDAAGKVTVKGIKTMIMHGHVDDPDTGQMNYRSEMMQPSPSDQNDSMSEEQLLNKFFVLKRRVNKLEEEKTLKPQTEIAGESRLTLHNRREKFRW